MLPIQVSTSMTTAPSAWKPASMKFRKVPGGLSTRSPGLRPSSHRSRTWAVTRGGASCQISAKNSGSPVVPELEETEVSSSTGTQSSPAKASPVRLR